MIKTEHKHHNTKTKALIYAIKPTSSTINKDKEILKGEKNIHTLKQVLELKQNNPLLTSVLLKQKIYAKHQACSLSKHIPWVQNHTVLRHLQNINKKTS